LAERLQFFVEMEDKASAGLKAMDAQMVRVMASLGSLDDVIGQTSGAFGALESQTRTVTSSLDAYTKAASDTATAQKHASDASSMWSDVLDTVGAGLTASVGILTGAAAAIAAMTVQVTGNAAEVGNWATRLGVSTEWMSRMQFAAGQAGLDIDGFGEAMQDVTERMADAAAGNAEYAALFEQLGVSVTDAQGNIRDINDVIPEMANGLKNVSNDSERTAIIMKLLGDEGSRLAPIFLKGSDGLDAMGKRADALGVTLGQGLVDESKRFRTGLSEGMAAVQGLANSLVAELLPSINELVPKIVDWVSGLRESSLVQDTLLPILRSVVEVLGVMVDHLDAVEVTWNLINSTFNTVVAAILGGVQWIVEGIATMAEKGAAAADALGFEGTASKLRGVSESLQGVGTDIGAMRQAAIETAAEWDARTDKLAEKQGKLMAGVKDTATAATAMGTAATQAGTAMTTAMQGATQATAGLNQAVDKAKINWSALGMQAPEAIKRAEQAASQAFLAIAQSGETTAAGLQRAWDATVGVLIQQGETLSDAWQGVQEAIRAGDVALAQERIRAAQEAGVAITREVTQTERAFEQSGVTSTRVLREQALESARAAQAIARDSATTHQDIVAQWEALRPKIIAAYGDVPRELAGMDRAIASGNAGTAQAILENWSGTFTAIPERYSGMRQAMQGVNEGIIADARGTTSSILESYDRVIQAQRELNAMRERPPEPPAPPARGGDGGRTGGGSRDRGAPPEDLTVVERHFGRIPEAIETRMATDVEGLQEQYAEVLRKLDHIQPGGGTTGFTTFMTGWAERQRETLLAFSQRIAERLTELGGSTPRETVGIGARAPEEDRVVVDLSRSAGGSAGAGMNREEFVRTSEALDMSGRRPALGSGINVTVNYTGVADPQRMVTDLRDAIDEAARRGDFHYVQTVGAR